MILDRYLPALLALMLAGTAQGAYAPVPESEEGKELVVKVRDRKSVV